MKIALSKSFLKGFTKTINLAGSKDWPDVSEGTMKDYWAIRRDWENVGSTIQEECNKYAASGK
jgi:hypothetical protein